MTDDDADAAVAPADRARRHAVAGPRPGRRPPATRIARPRPGRARDARRRGRARRGRAGSTSPRSAGGPATCPVRARRPRRPSTGGDDALVALVVAAEAAAALGRPTEARRLAGLALAASGGRSIDPVFAGMPRSAVWPADPAEPRADRRRRCSRRDRQRAPARRAGRRADARRGDRGRARGGGRRRRPGRHAERRRSPPAPRRRRVLGPAGDRPSAPAPAVTGDAADAAAGPRSRRGPRRGRGRPRGRRLASAALASRPRPSALAPAIAPVVLEAIGGTPDAGLQLVRGDAYRAVGRETDARRAYEAAMAAAGSAVRSTRRRRSRRTEARPRRHGDPRTATSRCRDDDSDPFAGDPEPGASRPSDTIPSVHRDPHPRKTCQPPNGPSSSSSPTASSASWSAASSRATRSAGLKLVGLKLVHVDRALAERALRGPPREAVLRGPGRLHHVRRRSSRLALEGPNAIAVVRAINGATRPHEAAPGHDPRRLRARDRPEHRPRVRRPGGRRRPSSPSGSRPTSCSTTSATSTAGCSPPRTEPRQAAGRALGGAGRRRRGVRSAATAPRRLGRATGAASPATRRRDDRRRATVAETPGRRTGPADGSSGPTERAAGRGRRTHAATASAGRQQERATVPARGSPSQVDRDQDPRAVRSTPGDVAAARRATGLRSAGPAGRAPIASRRP